MVFASGFLASLCRSSCRSLAIALTSLGFTLPAMAEKIFVRPELAAAALKYESRLKAEADPAGRPLAQWLKDGDAALKRNDLRAAAKIYAAAANLEPRNINHLLRLADLYGRIDSADNYSERLDFRARGTAFAYLAYQRAVSPPDEARALSVLGRGLAAQSLWRPAIEALKASLAAREDPPTRQFFEDVDTQHGFRILDYRIDADAASARACFEFSETLPKKFDAAPYVAVEGGLPGGVSVEEQQLCVDGLKHGERYQIAIRQGLPNSLGEKLRRPAAYALYVRDRTPSLRFTGRNYILPRKGQTGIPLVSVNLSQAALTLYRYGERSLAPTVLGDDFLSALSGNNARNIGREFGQKLWEGSLVTENRLNEEITTAVPVSEALGGDLKPGLYVLVARRPDLSTDDADYEPQATQWFVISDLGLTSALSDEGLTISLRSLAEAAPLAGVTLRLIARNNEVLASVKTDEAGLANFAAGLVNGEGGDAPGIITAEKDGDYAFLSLQAQAFDFADRGVSGRAAPGPLDAFVATERGVYRSGETVHVTALLRDGEAAAAPRLALHLVVERPDGVEARRVLVEDGGAGGRAWQYDLPPGAVTGTYRIKAYADPKRPPIGQTTFLVEDYVPDRLELTLSSKPAATSRETPAVIDVEGRWLFGAPAAGLSLQGETIISPAEAPPPALAGYKVGLLDEEVLDQRNDLAELPATGADGKASFPLALPEMPVSLRPMKVDALIRLIEAGGRGVERKLSLPIAEKRSWIGVKPLFGDLIGEGETANFDVAVIGPDGKRAAAGLKWRLSRIDTRFQWFRAEGRWSFDKVTSARLIASGDLSATANEPGRIASKVEWGRYRLEVVSARAGEAATSIIFFAGTAGSTAPDAPDMLEVAADKPAYVPGEMVKLRVNARNDAEATLYIAGDKIHHARNLKLLRGANTIEIAADAAWGVGAYAVLSAIRPLDEAQRRQPGRAIGVHWLAIDTKARTLNVALQTPALARPRQQLAIPVKLDLAAGEEAFLTVAAVDVGILNLTNYQAPDANAYFYGKRLLGTEFRDIYGYLIDGMQGTRGRLRSGGDGGAEGLQASPPTQAPLALFSGLVKVGSDGTAIVNFDLPDFAGTVRVMALAWSKGRLGHASADVVVRDPVALTLSAPRFLNMGDRSRLLVEVNNVEGPAGEYRLKADISGPARLATGSGPHFLPLAAGGRISMVMPVSAQGIGTAAFTFTLDGPGGITTQAQLNLPLKPANPAISRRSVREIAAGAWLEFGSELLADVVPGSGNVSLSVAASPALDAGAALAALERYPFTCTEQTVARSMPLLYLSELKDAQRKDPQGPADTNQAIRAAIDRILNRQSSSGSFGLWSAGGGDLWLDALVGDFLTRARERAVAVPQIAFNLLLDRLRNATANQSNQIDDGTAYALYVLARNGRPVIGDLRYIADTRAHEDLSALARGQVAAALSLLGDRNRATPLFTKAVDELTSGAGDEPGRSDYGSILRDGAALITLIGESQLPSASLQRSLAAIEKARTERRFLSTQENMWLALAARAANAVSGTLSYTLDGRALTGPRNWTFTPEELTGRKLRLTNTSPAPLPVVLTVDGAPVTPEPAAAQGLQVEKTYFRPDGTKTDLKSVRQNDRIIVVIKITDPDPPFAHLVLADPLAAGFEIDSPALVDSAKLTGLPGASEGPVIAHKEFRDDRFVAAFDRDSDAPPQFEVAYVMRAVSPGRFALGGAMIEDMYHPERFARTAPATVEITQAP